jgi:hypothetical protein
MQRLARGEDMVSAALDRAGGRIAQQPVLIWQARYWQTRR